MTLETVCRLRDPRGRVSSEFTFRGRDVECVFYWPSGVIQAHGLLTLDQFQGIVCGVRDARLDFPSSPHD